MIPTPLPPGLQERFHCILDGSITASEKCNLRATLYDAYVKCVESGQTGKQCIQQCRDDGNSKSECQIAAAGTCINLCNCDARPNVVCNHPCRFLRLHHAPR